MLFVFNDNSTLSSEASDILAGLQPIHEQANGKREYVG
jgi:hypothetical protein